MTVAAAALDYAVAAAFAQQHRLQAEQQERLRRLVLSVLEAGASLPGSSSSVPELTFVMALLEKHPRQPWVVTACCRLLLQLLISANAATQSALRELQLLAALPRLLLAQLPQQQPERRQAREAQDAAAAAAAVEDEKAAQQAEEARCSALQLLGSYLGCDAAPTWLAGCRVSVAGLLHKFANQPARIPRRVAGNSKLMCSPPPHVPPVSRRLLQDRPGPSAGRGVRLGAGLRPVLAAAAAQDPRLEQAACAGPGAPWVPCVKQSGARM